MEQEQARQEAMTHDKLMEKILDLDPEYRKSRSGEGKECGSVVAVAVHFHGVDMEKMRRGNTEVIEATVLPDIPNVPLKEEE